MVETIAPVVYGKRRDYRAAVALHAIAATLSSAVFGTFLASAGSALGAPWGRAGFVTVAGAGLLYSLRELAGLPLPLFDRKRQVPEWWRTFYSPPVAAALYGAGLGIGFLTFLRHGTFVVVSTLAVATGHPLLGAAVVAPFGLARGLSTLASARAAGADATGLLVARLELLAQGRRVSVINGIACLTVAAVGLLLI